jgi:N-methylhydantoinase A/oxoprolinase/acetone carboxylase beta subunit
MGLFIGIDVGGTFTDFLVMDGGEAEVFKVLSTPGDPSIGFMDGLEKIAASSPPSTASSTAPPSPPTSFSPAPAPRRRF